jgi:hypothetical protein
MHVFVCVCPALCPAVCRMAAAAARMPAPLHMACLSAGCTPPATGRRLVVHMRNRLQLSSSIYGVSSTPVVQARQQN